METLLIKKKPYFTYLGKGIPKFLKEFASTRIKRPCIIRNLIMALVLLNFLSGLEAQNSYSLKSVKATIQGTSTLHDWESDITKILFKGSLNAEGKMLKTIKDVEVKVPVASIKSKEGKIMDNKTYDAFKYEKNPFIIYTFNLAQARTENNLVSIDASGTLTMAGVIKPVAITAKGKVMENGDLQLTISKRLKMTEFNMVPPTAMMGAIKVGDEVTVNFNLVLSLNK